MSRGSWFHLFLFWPCFRIRGLQCLSYSEVAVTKLHWHLKYLFFISPLWTIFLSCKTDNCNSQPTALGPEPSTTKKPVAAPDIEVDPVPSSSSSSSKDATEQKNEDKEEEELAGRLAESDPAELDIGRNDAALAHPFIFALLLNVILPLLCEHTNPDL